RPLTHPRRPLEVTAEPRSTARRCPHGGREYRPHRSAETRSARARNAEAFDGTVTRAPGGPGAVYGGGAPAKGVRRPCDAHQRGRGGNDSGAHRRWLPRRARAVRRRTTM